MQDESNNSEVLNHEKQVVLLTFLGDRDPYPVDKLSEDPENASYFYNIPQNQERDTRGPVLSYCVASGPQCPNIAYIFYVEESDTQVAEGVAVEETEASKNLHHFVIEESLVNSSSRPAGVEPRRKPKYTELRLAKIGNILNVIGIKVVPKRLEVKDATDFVELLNAMGATCQDIQQNHTMDEITVLVSPGTPQMQAAWYVLINEGRLKAIPYRKIENSYGGSVKQVSIEPLFEAETAKTALELFRRYDFMGAALLMEHLYNSINKNRREICQFLAQIFSAYALWDKMNYELAQSQFLKINIPKSVSTNPQFEALIETLQLQSQALKSMIDQNTVLQVVDLVCSAERYRTTGRPADALWRCATAYELLLDRAIMDNNLLRAEETLQKLDVPARQVRIATTEGMKRLKKTRIAVSINGGKNLEVKLLDALISVRQARNRLFHEAQSMVIDSENRLVIRWANKKRTYFEQRHLDYVKAMELTVDTFYGTQCCEHPFSQRYFSTINTYLVALLEGHS